MNFEIKGIGYQELDEHLKDMVTNHDLRTYQIYYVKDFSDSKNPYLPNTFILKINKRYWLKTWEDCGCGIKDTKEGLEWSLKEKFIGMGFNGVEVRLVE